MVGGGARAADSHEAGKESLLAFTEDVLNGLVHEFQKGRLVPCLGLFNLLIIAPRKGNDAAHRYAPLGVVKPACGEVSAVAIERYPLKAPAVANDASWMEMRVPLVT